jgi:hypothetical protein
MSILNIDNSIPVGFTSGACGEFSTAFSPAFPVCRALEGVVPIEANQSIFLDGVLNIELLSQIGVDKKTAVEIVVANSNFDFSFPIELLGSIADDEIIPVSYLGVGVTVEALVWLLDSREVIWSLNARQDTWTPATREEILSLKERLSEQKPIQRGSTWTL